MNRWGLIWVCSLCIAGAACSNDDGESVQDGGAATGATNGASGASGSSAGDAGSSGAQAGQAGMSSSAGAGAGTSANAGSGDSGSSNDAGTNGTSGTNGDAGASGTSGDAGASGTSGDAGASGTGDDAGSNGGMACGSRGLPPCPNDSFCNFPDSADCGRADAPGRCSPITDVACPEIWAPVCGCDGTTYSSACHARAAGMSIDHEDECDGAGPPPGYQCVAEGAICLIAPPECPDQHVPSISGACFGPCVPIEACDCEGPDDCPNPEMYTCHLSAGHCGPYVN